MYHEFFGLKQSPFKITPDTRLFYSGGSRGEILEALVYAVSSGEGMIKVVGEVGSGKTMLCRMLEVKLPKHIEVVYLANPSLSAGEILHAIAIEMSLPVEAAANRLQVMHILQRRLLEMHADNRQVVLFVEEAQAMPLETLEEIRLLSNLETQQHKLLQIVLFGQPELDRNLDQENIRQLKERITHSFYLEPLSLDEIREYMRFRLHAVGYRGRDAFKKSAYKALARASRGLTRRVNILADKSMLAAFANGTHTVTPRHVRVAVEDNEPPKLHSRGWAPGWVTALVLLVIGGGVGWLASKPALRNISLAQVSSLFWDRPQAVSAPAVPAAPPAELAAAAPAAGIDTPASPANDHSADRAPANESPVAPANSPDSTAPADTNPLISPVVAEVARGQDAKSDASRTETAVALTATPPQPAQTPVTTMATALGPVSEDEPLVAVVADTVAVGDSERDNAPSTVDAGSAAATDERNASQDAPSRVAAETEVNVMSSDEVTTSSVAVSGAPAQGAVASSTVMGLPEQEPVASREQIASAELPLATPQPAEASPFENQPSSQAEQAPAPPADDVSASPADLLSQRIEATRAWLSGVGKDHYSIQLMATAESNRTDLEGFLSERARAGELDQVYVYLTEIRGKRWFGVLFNDFASFRAARAALADLPAEIKRHKPFIRNIRDITTLG